MSTSKVSCFSVPSNQKNFLQVTLWLCGCLQLGNKIKLQNCNTILWFPNTIDLKKITNLIQAERQLWKQAYWTPQKPSHLQVFNILTINQCPITHINTVLLVCNNMILIHWSCVVAEGWLLWRDTLNSASSSNLFPQQRQGQKKGRDETFIWGVVKKDHREEGSTKNEARQAW